MAERIVVGFLTQIGSATAASSYTARLVALREKAEALGGRLCALGSQSIAFDFAVSDLEQAIALAVGAREQPEADREAGLLPWGVAVAQGELSAVGDEVAGSEAALGSFVVPAWGPPLVTAIALARLAHPGEVLIDPEIPGV